jgi:hypothetical protein
VAIDELHPRVPGADCRYLDIGHRVARELDRLLIEPGKPRTIVSDNGTEFTSNAILRADDRAGQAGTERVRCFIGRLRDAYIE